MTELRQMLKSCVQARLTYSTALTFTSHPHLLTVALVLAPYDLGLSEQPFIKQAQKQQLIIIMSSNGTALPTQDPTNTEGGFTESKGKGKALAEDVHVEDTAMDEDDDDEDEEDEDDDDEEVFAPIPPETERWLTHRRRTLRLVRFKSIVSCKRTTDSYLGDDEDGMEEIDLDNIVEGGRRTRGAKIDFAKAAEENPVDDDDEDEDDEDFQPPDDDTKMSD